MRDNITLYFEHFIVPLISAFFFSFLLRLSKHKNNRTLTQLNSSNISNRYCKCVKSSIIDESPIIV